AVRRENGFAMDPARDPIVVLGEVLGAYGVRGSLKVRPFTELPDTLLGHATWWLKAMRGSDWRAYQAVGGKLVWGALLVTLMGIESREAALAMKGALVGVQRNSLPAAGEDEYYWNDLTGFAVRNRAGVLLGEVSGLTEHGAHPLLRVAPPSGVPGAERLIPFVPAIVDRVD